MKNGCCCTVAAAKYTAFEGCYGTCSRNSSRAKNKKKMIFWGFPWPCLARRIGKRSRDYLPARSTVNVQSTRHGSRPGAKVAPRSVHAAPLRAVQPRARGRLTAGREKHGHVQKVCIWRIYILLCTNVYIFLEHLHSFLRRPWVFSCALGCGARRGPACTPRRKFWSRPGSVARAVGVQSREILASNHGVAFRGAKAEQDNGKPTVSCFAALR